MNSSLHRSSSIPLSIGILNNINQSTSNSISLSRRNTHPISDQYQLENTSNHNQSLIKKSHKMEIETKTSSKNISIAWHIDKQSIDIAKLAQRGDKKGVILADLTCDGYLFKLELCAPGWRNSQAGFSAFYLTVPKINHSSSAFQSSFPDTANDAMLSSSENTSTAITSSFINSAANTSTDNSFVARYSVLFGESEEHIRVSSIRNDFDLGVGFPNFTEISTLDNAISNEQLVFHIQIDIFSCESILKKNKTTLENSKCSSMIAAKLMRNMFSNLQHTNVCIMSCDCKIFAHKSILTAASPVFETYFKYNCKESETGQILMNDWEPTIVNAMVRFLYLGVIEFTDNQKFRNVFENKSNLGIDDSEYLSLDNEPSQYTFDENMTQMRMEKKENILDCLCSASINKENRNKTLEMEEEYKSMSESSSLISDVSLASTVAAEDTKTQLVRNLMMRNNSDIDVCTGEMCECPLVVKQLFQLFQLAECYKMSDLVVCCCQQLYEHLSIETACIFLMYLDKFSHVTEIKEIKIAIWDYMSLNVKAIKCTKGWKELIHFTPHLLSELIDRLTTNNT